MMSAYDVTDSELSDFIIATLAKNTGHGRSFWRHAIGDIVVTSEPAIGSNWSFPTTAIDDTGQFEAVIASVRKDFPFVVKH